jgi:adenylate cyclase
VWIRRNAAGQEIARGEGPGGTYDPRTRPWYAPALASDAIVWSDVYSFYTGSGFEPGVSASVRYNDADARTFVLAVDIAPSDLSHFLESLKIGQSGRAMIVDDAGRMIAYPQVQRLLHNAASGPVASRIDEVGDDVAAGAYDHFRIEGPGRRTVRVGARRYLATFAPLKEAGRDWSLLILGPENDFISFVGRNNRTALLMSLAIVVLTALGAAFLVRQGLRADRTTRLMVDRERAIARQRAALDNLAEHADLFDPSQDHPPEALTETAADVTGAQRVSLWYLAEDGGCCAVPTVSIARPRSIPPASKCGGASCHDFSNVSPRGRRSTLSMPPMIRVPPRCAA